VKEIAKHLCNLYQYLQIYKLLKYLI